MTQASWGAALVLAAGLLTGAPGHAQPVPEQIAVPPGTDPAAEIGPAPRLAAAVGVVKAGTGSGGCSGALIRPDVVLTAAHCLSTDKRVFAAGTTTFRTGSYPGLPGVERTGAEIVVHPLYQPDDPDIDRRTGYDLALLRLAEPVPAAAALPLPISTDPVTAARLILASYRGGKGDRARERSCPTVEAGERMIVIGCDVRGGESGAPLFQRGAAGLAVVGVMSARTERGFEKLGFAASTGRVRQVLALLGPPRAP